MSNHWKKTSYDGGVKTTFVHQPHENKLYVHREHADNKQFTDTNEVMRREKPFRSDALGSGKLKFVFRWPDTIVRNAVHAQFPDIKSKDPDERVRAYHQMAIAYPQYVAQVN